MSEANDKGLMLQLNADKISKMTGYSAEEVAVVKNSVARKTTDTELAYFLSVCKSVDLNPFIKEIWCYKDNKGNLLVFAGRDGHRTYAQRNPNYAGMRSCEVCEKDEFSIDIANNQISHKFGLEDRGNIKGAYAIVFRKDGEPSVAYVDFKTYNKGSNAWKTHPAAMIKKVAETNALKSAFGIAGVQSEYEYDIKGQTAVPIETVEAEVVDDLKEKKKEVWAILKTKDRDERESYTTMIKEKEEAGELTVDMLEEIKNDLQDGEEKAD